MFTNLYQSSQMLQDALHRKMQEVIVSQIESSQINSWKHAQREAPQQVGVEKQQLQRRHCVEGPGVDHVDLIILEIKKSVIEERAVLRSIKTYNSCGNCYELQ